MNILIVGGTFDNNGGKPSSIVDKIFNYASKEDHEVVLINGGHYDSLPNIIELPKDYNVVFWFANVPNDLPKIRNVKELSPKTLLVSSKRNDDEKYNFAELVNKALETKANLVFEFSKVEDKKFNTRIFDPLGVVWFDGTDLEKAVEACIHRLEFLRSVTRVGTVGLNLESLIEVPAEEKYLELVKHYAEVFHECINPAKGVTRFLGNTSFRCQRGFPSFRDVENRDYIYVSKRNVDKRFIDKDSFVKTFKSDKHIFYYGKNKPSVDTPVQLSLYEVLPNINYMLHAHCYIQGAPFTERTIPCGALEEVEEILEIIDCQWGSSNLPFYAINLKGHGSIVMSETLEQMEHIDFRERKVPEDLSHG